MIYWFLEFTSDAFYAPKKNSTFDIVVIIGELRGCFQNAI